MLTQLPPAKPNVNRALVSLRRALRFDVGYLLVAMLCLPAVWPLMSPTLFASTDGLYHLYRLVDLDFCIRGWDLYPRWLPNLGFGYGYPVLNYYAPLTYYLAEVFHMLGSGYVASIELTFMAGFLLSAVCMYLYAKELMGRGPGIIAAVAYVYLPYHLSDCYVKGALAEFSAFVFLPLILWMFHRLMMRRQRRYLPLAAVSYAGLILTHNLSALVFSPFLLAYTVLLLALRREIKPLWYASLAILLGVGLSAFYWYPGFRESLWVLAGRVGSTAKDSGLQFISLRELLSHFVIYRYYPHDDGGMGVPFSLIEVGLAGLSVLVLVRLRRTLTLSTRYHLLFFVAATLLSLFMMLRFSSFLWKSLPLLPYLQYPWRFLLVTSLSNSLLIGSALLLFAEFRHQAGATRGSKRLLFAGITAGLTIGLLLIVANLGHLAVQPMYLPGNDEAVTEQGVNLAGMAQFDYVISVMVRLWGFTWGLEYLPSPVEVPREEFFLPMERPPSDRQQLAPGEIPHVVLGKQGPLSRALRIYTASDLRLSFHTFYFPGWQFYVDGQKVPSFPSGPLGLVTTHIASGEHQVLLVFENTPARTAGTAISLASLSLLVLSSLVLLKHKKLLLVPLAALVLVMPLVWRHAQSSPSVQHPTPLEANLGDQVKLLGYHLDDVSYRPGDTVNVTLYWLALQEMDKNYKVFVHLTDENETHLIAQSDRWPVYNFSPTTRWEPGEIVWDRHEVRIPLDETPGTRRLTAGMYPLETMQNLSVLDEEGNPQGTRVPLASIDVRP